MLKIDRMPLHWRTYKALSHLVSCAGVEWYRPKSIKARRWNQRFNTDHTEARRFCALHGITTDQACEALQRNYRWHEEHPGKAIRYGDIPF